MRRSVSWLVLSVLFGSLAVVKGGDKLPDQVLLADAKEDVTQALLAEAQGDNSTRTKRLSKAWLAAPDLAEANWHMARIRVADEWRPLAEIVSTAANDPDQEQYRTLRERAAASPRALRDLARWCAKLGWYDRARLHYAQLLAHPKAEAGQKSEAVEKLNLVPVGGAWLTKEEVAARQEEAKAIQESLVKWRPRLKALQQIIDGDDFERRDQAIAELDKLNDPTMIPALESFLHDAKADFQEQAVKKLAAYKEVEATQALLHFGVRSDHRSIRELAAVQLQQRPFHEFVPELLDGLIAPFESRFVVTKANDGSVAYSHVTKRESAHAIVGVATNQKAVPRFGSLVGNPWPIGDLRVSRNSRFWRLQNQIASKTAQNAYQANLQLAVQNLSINEANRPTLAVLATVTGLRSDQAPKEWFKWWQDYNEYSWPKPSYYLCSASCEYHESPSPYLFNTGRASCFLAGTPVRTEMGTVPIESIKPGDRVLAQDQDTGELAYKVVLRTTLRPPARMVEIKAGGETIHTTLGHPFWVAGRGWQMAKQLKAGDLLHGLAGATPIESVNAAGEHGAHNLVVDDTNTYFVGRSGLLVHDNEFRKPTRAIVPGLVRE